MMVKRAHLSRDLGCGAAVIALVAVTSARTQVWRRARRPDQGRITVRKGEAQRAHSVYPSDAVAVRCAQPGRPQRSRRYWDTGEWGDGTIEPERPQPERPQLVRPRPERPAPEQPMAVASAAWGRPLAAVSTSTSTLTSASICPIPSSSPIHSHRDQLAEPHSRPGAKRGFQR